LSEIKTIRKNVVEPHQKEKNDKKKNDKKNDNQEIRTLQQKN